MDCARIDLIGYHFGTQDDEDVEAVEQHLVGCTRCLRSYLALKRHADRTARPDRPSDAMRARLRADVERAFCLSPGKRALGWLARPIPLYTGLAAAAVALVIAAVAPTFAERAGSGFSRGLRDGERVDTSRRVAETLTIY